MTKKNAFNCLSNKYSQKAQKMHKAFQEMGVNFASGVPCGVLKHIIKNINDDEKIIHIVANRESEAIGLIAGAYFAGKVPIAYMQNSGLFAASNDIASLLIPYNIPVFFVVSYRGYIGEDAVQHLTTGRATEKLLKSFHLPFTIFENQELNVLIKSMFKQMEKIKLPVFLLLKRGWQK